MAERAAADVRGMLAPGQSEARLQLADGTPLSGWLSSPDAFDQAVAQALERYPREQIRVQHDLAL